MEGNEIMSGSGITELAVTKSRASRRPMDNPVSFRDADSIAMEGNEVREIAIKCEFDKTTDCEESGTHPPAEMILKAVGELLLMPIVEPVLSTFAEPMFNATVELSLAVSSGDSDLN
jgi:hypothetical protein